MTDFTKIKSKYVKNKIKGLEMTARNKKYIEDLMDIERAVTGKIYGLWSGYKINSLQDNYPIEWDAIGSELDPKHVSLKKQRAKDAKETKKIVKQEKDEEKKEHLESEKTWKKVSTK